MRIKIELISNNHIILPVGFNQFIQALIYNHLEIDSRRWLHEYGFNFENRKFRLFVFSSILERGRFDKYRKEFRFPEMVSFYISSPVDWLLEQLAKNFIRSEKVILGRNTLKVSSFSVLDPVDIMLL